MKTLKSNLKKEDVWSKKLKRIVTGYSKRDVIRISLFASENVLHLAESKEAEVCINLAKRWLEDDSVNSEELRVAAYAAISSVPFVPIKNASIYAAANTALAINRDDFVDYALHAITHVVSFQKGKERFYKNFARLFAYEDLNFPYKDFAKTFNLDNQTDLNIYLDFLTDNYPEVFKDFSREEYLNYKIAKEYLKVIYQ